MNYKWKSRLYRILRYSHAYRDMRRRFQMGDNPDVEAVVKEAIAHVPYYKDYGRYIVDGFDLGKLPVIRKPDISQKEDMFVSDRRNLKRLKQIETGGSTGYSLKLYRSFRDVINGIAMADDAFLRIGTDLRVAVLRGQKPKKGICERIDGKTILLSSYNLNQNTVDEYLECLKRYEITCLHVYPSSITILARLIKQKYGKADLPLLKGIFASSEIFDKENKRLVKDAFPGVKIVDYYGHNEQSCCAMAVDDGYFYFNPQCGYVEFADTGERIHGNRIAEIVTTSMMNKTMPFIRYATEDYVELDDLGRVVSIIGRTSDFVVNGRGEIVPCIMANRPLTLKNVVNFQYFQDQQGKLVFRVVTSPAFDRNDETYILEDLATSFGEDMECCIEKVNRIEHTKAGKQMRLIQHLEIKSFINSH